jgi:predicted enzyme related to lactoylglutathione lyase
MSHRSRLAGFIIDCQDTDSDTAAAFWSAALGLQALPAETDSDGAQYTRLRDAPGELQVEVQRVSHSSRVHLDIEADDIDAEADRLEALGARRIGFVKRWWVMEAPTGHRFCVVAMKHPARGQTPNTWE